MEYACSKSLVIGISLLVLWPQLSLTLSTARQSGVNCGVFGWTVPSPPKNAKLVQVHTVIRHGDRTPWTGDYCWPNDSSVWDCYLNPAEIPMFSDTQYGPVIPRVYRKVYKFGDEEMSGNCSVGQLTVIGYNQQILNGKSLRKAYVDSGFLNNKITPSEIYFRSDDVPRTRESGEALLLGMFPSNGSHTEIIDLHTMDSLYEYMAPNGNLCPKYEEYYKEFPTSKTWMDHWNITQSVLKNISTAINFTVDEADLDHFDDCLTTHYCHKLPWPKGMTEELYNEAFTEFSWQFYHFLKYPSVQANSQVGIGFLLKEFWQQMNATVKGEPIEKFLLYSGHDSTLIPILVALQLDDGIWTPYASMILMELYSVSSGSGYSVRIIYNGQVMKMPFCGSATLCDYKTFSEYMATITPSDPAKQCLMKQKWNWF